jgi:hypothetical protein
LRRRCPVAGSLLCRRDRNTASQACDMAIVADLPSNEHKVLLDSLSRLGGWIGRYSIGLMDVETCGSIRQLTFSGFPRLKAEDASLYAHPTPSLYIKFHNGTPFLFNLKLTRLVGCRSSW